jgi:hypothetical protein
MYRFHKFVTGLLLEVSGQLQYIHRQGLQPLYIRLRGPECQPGCSGEEKTLTSLTEIKSHIT